MNRKRVQRTSEGRNNEEKERGKGRGEKVT